MLTLPSLLRIFSVAVARRPPAKLTVQVKLAPASTFCSDGQETEETLVVKRFFEVCLDRFLDLGAVDHRCPAARQQSPHANQRSRRSEP